MTVATSVVLQQTLTNQQGNWSSGPLTVGTFTELDLDTNFTALSDYTIVTLSRLDAFSNPQELWGAAHDAGTASDSVDVGACDAYACSRTFGNTVRIDIQTSGTISGTLSLQGKG